MGLFDRIRPGAKAASTPRRERSEQAQEVLRHLTEFVHTRVGVEAYVEPATAVLPPTVLLVATTGEWTRRRAPDPGLIRHLADDLHVPVYDARLVGYPQRMRAWNERVKRGEAGPSPAG